MPIFLIDQGLFSVPALVFELAQLTSQKRFNEGYVICEPSTTFLGTSYGQIMVAILPRTKSLRLPNLVFCNRQKSEENAPGAPVLIIY